MHMHTKSTGFNHEHAMLWLPLSESVPVRYQQQTTRELSLLDAGQQERERQRDVDRERVASLETTLHHTLTDKMTWNKNGPRLTKDGLIK